jgi:hypothetical protein
VKEGGNTKNWKRRWFVVKPSYNVEYYENEAVCITFSVALIFYHFIIPLCHHNVIVLLV